MRISWRELDWISERDRTEIERRMQVMGGSPGLLDRVDFAGRTSGGSGPFEIRITAAAAKRQIIAVRRDAQRVRAFNSAFAALERSVASVLKNQPAPPRAARPEPAARPALVLPKQESRLRTVLRHRGTRAALAGALTALALLGLWMQRGAGKMAVAAPVDVAAPDADAVFSAVAVPVEAFSAVARLSTGER
jgi:hypothetical protein